MPSKPSAKTRYANQRPRRTPPHVSLGLLRLACGLTIDAVIDKIADATNGEYRPERGTISAVENGIRGASQQLLAALEIAYGLPEGSITTSYEPKSRELPRSA